MRALQVVKPRQFRDIETARPEAGDNQILVRLEKAVLCGSDIPKFTGMWRGLRYPLPPGMPIHECVGVVVDSHSPRFQVGDRVVAIPSGDRGLAEYYVADAIKAVCVPEPLIDSDTNLLIQPLSTVVYALDRLGDIAGCTALVVGLGPIGLLATWLLDKHGASKVIGVDPIAWRCEAARQLGAAQTFETNSERLLPLIAQDDAWAPADICIEAVGQQTRTINHCLHLVRRCGQVLAMGVPLEPIYPFDFERFFRQNIDLIASVTPPDETYMMRAADLICQHEGALAFLITHRFTLDKVAQAYALYETPNWGHSLKILIDGTSWPTMS
jgi:threonine dehydrogenase-like Zn-dependent dehydrogenase